MSFRHKHVPARSGGAVSYQSRLLIPTKVFLETGSAWELTLQDAQRRDAAAQSTLHQFRIKKAVILWAHLHLPSSLVTASTFALLDLTKGGDLLFKPLHKTTQSSAPATAHSVSELPEPSLLGALQTQNHAVLGATPPPQQQPKLNPWGNRNPKRAQCSVQQPRPCPERQSREGRAFSSPYLKGAAGGRNT